MWPPAEPLDGTDDMQYAAKRCQELRQGLLRIAGDIKEFSGAYRITLLKPLETQATLTLPGPKQVAATQVEVQVDAWLASLKNFSAYLIKMASCQTKHDKRRHDTTWSLWYLCIIAAAIGPPTMVDRLVKLIIWTREFDAQTRAIRATLQVDLVPHFADWDAYGFGSFVFWQTVRELSVPMDAAEAPRPAELRSKAAFSADCFSLGVCHDGMAAACLTTMRLALEQVDRRKVSDRAKRALPAAVAWLQGASHRVRALTTQNCIPSVQSSLSLGPDAPQEFRMYEEWDQGDGTYGWTGAVGCRSDLPPGYNWERWDCWLDALQVMTNDDDEDGVACWARIGFREMITCGRDLRLKTDRETLFMDNVIKSLEDARETSGNEQITVENLEFDTLGIGHLKGQQVVSGPRAD